MNDYLQTKELYHHGIKGQKWGIRRENNEVSEQNTNTPKKDHTNLKIAAGVLVGTLVSAAVVGAGAAYFVKKQKENMLKKIHDDHVYWGKVGAAVRAQNLRAAAYEKVRISKGAEYVKNLI